MTKRAVCTTPILLSYASSSAPQLSYGDCGGCTGGRGDDGQPYMTVLPPMTSEEDIFQQDYMSTRNPRLLRNDATTGRYDNYWHEREKGILARTLHGLTNSVRRGFRKLKRKLGNR
ncbi:hypothetical protein OF83DRAFT_817909 [Amylostereum chailletii]|nr:hypothetical protein OF83DRAFT_817909 [Amylostereum chailletii]